ncbi:MAG: insulinase family protein [Candidatus Aminicenantes bacterium]|nr:MAG: insulinase family protein [Candidatus Aminicenantes bacterium]
MVEKTVLDTGLVVLTEYIPAFPSFALSFTLRGGSRTETKENSGIHHLIEHMMFKGNQKYDLKQIADISDRLGGKLNALTGKEITQFYIKAVDEHLKQAFDLLTQMMIDSIFPGEEFLKEKSITIQEIHEAEDDPDTHAFETFYKKIFGDNGLAYPIGGLAESVSSFERDRVFEFYKKNYTPDNLVLAAVGKVNHQELVDLAANAFKDFPCKKPKESSFQTPLFRHQVFSKKNASLKQTYVIIGFNGISIVSPLKNQFMILNDILGAGMSSRLFQKIREEKGIAYTISSFSDAYLDCGTHLTYSVVEPAKTEEYLTAVKDEILQLKKHGITRDELIRARDSIKSSVILALESRVSKMRFNVNNELSLKREVTPGEIIDDINNTTIDDINQLFKDYFNLEEMAIFLYGAVST